MSMKINKLEIENVKRVKAVTLKPTENGLTIIGGRNNQGKTSVLDSIAWALGGERYRPSQAAREGSAIPPRLKIVMNNGLVVERTGKNSSLKVTDPSGKKAGQQLLNEFVEELALNLPKFMEAGNREKAETLLKIIGVGDRLKELDKAEKELYNERQMIGRIADQKEKFAKEQPYFPEAPDAPLSATELIKRQQEILAKNGENQRKRQNAAQLQEDRNRAEADMELARQALKKAEDRYRALCADCETAQRDAQELLDESTAELEESIAGIEESNRKVRANLDKERAEEDAREYRRQYQELTKKLEGVRKDRTDLLEAAELPLPELSVADGELVYKGHKWDNMSGSDQLKVSAAIVRRLNPECGFVLMDKLEQMDLETLTEFGKWLEAEGLQAIATRVSTGGECSVIISDGYAEQEGAAEKPVEMKEWKKGVF